MELIDPVDVLEARICAMEKIVFGKSNSINIDMDAIKSISDLLLNVNTLILSALTGRETITSTLKNMSELNTYLDPNFEDDYFNSDAKKEYLLAIAPEIKETAENLQKLSKLSKVLDSDSIQNVPSLTSKLEELTTVNLNLKEESDSVSESVTKTLQQYNDIIHSITKSFAQMENILTEVEIARSQKKTLE